MLTEFIRYLEAERRYSPLTVRNYRHDVELFLAWLDVDEATLDPRTITGAQLREWILYRSRTGNLKASSQNRELASLRTLFRWLLRTGRIERDVMRSIPSLRSSKRLPAFVPESRMNGIVGDCRTESDDFTVERNALIVLLFYACGIRLAELVGIDRSDFSDDYRTLRVRGKGDKQRLIPVMEFVREKNLC